MLTGNLEYLISSLPNLTFGNSEAIQHEVKGLFKKYSHNPEVSDDLQFVLHEDACKYLSTSQFVKFQSIELNSIHHKNFQNSSIEVVAEFSKFMYQLKSELKSYRLNRKSDESVGRVNYELFEHIPDNPLLAEEFLLKIQWEKLEALSIGHYTSLSALILYKLKLELLLHWWQFDVEAGFKVFQNSLNLV